MEKAREGARPAPDSTLVARRCERELIKDLGSKNSLSAQQLEIISHIRADKETLQDLYACRDSVLEARPGARKNIAVLAKLDSYIAPVQSRIVVNLTRLGLERRARTIDLAPWEREQATEASLSSDGGNTES